MLELCKPFFSTDPSAPKLDLIRTDYAASPQCRLDLNGEPCFTQGIISEQHMLLLLWSTCSLSSLLTLCPSLTSLRVPPYPGAEERLARGSGRFFPQGTSFKFVCECFFITQRALHVGVIPAVNTFTKILSDLNKQIGAQIGAELGGNEKLLKELNAVSPGAGVLELIQCIHTCM